MKSNFQNALNQLLGLGRGINQLSRINPPVDHSISLHDTRPNLNLARPNLNIDRLHQLGIESPELMRSISIRDIRVGMRVPAQNPQYTDTERAEFELDIDPATWRTFTLEVDKLDGSGTVTATLLRPADWMVEQILEIELLLTVALIEDAIEEYESRSPFERIFNDLVWLVSTDPLEHLMDVGQDILSWLPFRRFDSITCLANPASLV